MAVVFLRCNTTARSRTRGTQVSRDYFFFRTSPELVQSRVNLDYSSGPWVECESPPRPLLYALRGFRRARESAREYLRPYINKSPYATRLPRAFHCVRHLCGRPCDHCKTGQLPGYLRQSVTLLCSRVSWAQSRAHSSVVLVLSQPTQLQGAYQTKTAHLSRSE